MVQFRILSGKKAGTEVVARRFPFRVGRARDADLRLEERGVWARHLEVTCLYPQGCQFQAHPDALTLRNGEVVRGSPLRNGDVLELGAARLQFWLSPTRQSGLRVREGLTWLGLAALALLQLAILHGLLE